MIHLTLLQKNSSREHYLEESQLPAELKEEIRIEAERHN